MKRGEGGGGVTNTKTFNEMNEALFKFPEELGVLLCGEGMDISGTVLTIICS